MYECLKEKKIFCFSFVAFPFTALDVVFYIHRKISCVVFIIYCCEIFEWKEDDVTVNILFLLKIKLQMKQFFFSSSIRCFNVHPSLADYMFFFLYSHISLLLYKNATVSNNNECDFTFLVLFCTFRMNACIIIIIKNRFCVHNNEHLKCSEYFFFLFFVVFFWVLFFFFLSFLIWVEWWWFEGFFKDL